MNSRFLRGLRRTSPSTLINYLVDPRRAIHRYFVFFLACCFIPGPYFHDTLLSAYKSQICAPSGLGISSTSFALLFGVPSAMGALSGPMASVTAMWGDARTSIISAAMTFVSSAGVVVSLDHSSYFPLLAFRLSFWLGLYLLLAVQMVIVYKLFTGPDLTIAMGFIIMSCRLGGMVAFLSSGLLLKFARGHVVAALWCSVALVGGAMLAAVLFAYLRGGTSIARTLLPIIEARVHGAAAGQNAGLRAELQFFSKSTWVVIAEVCILYSVVFPFEAIETSFLEADWGLSVDYVGWYTSMGTFFGLFSWAWGLCVATPRGLLLCSCVAWFSMILAFIGLWWRSPENPGIAFVAICTFGVSYSFLSTACWILIPGTFGRARDCSSAAVSTAYVVMSFGMLVSNFSAGVLRDYSDYGAVCVWFVMLCIAGLLSAITLSWLLLNACSDLPPDASLDLPSTIEVEVAVCDAFHRSRSEESTVNAQCSEARSAPHQEGSSASQPDGPEAVTRYEGYFGGTPLQDRVAEAVVRRFDGLPGRGKPQGSAWTVLAGIVAEEPDLPLRVLSLATGTRCIGVAAMTQGRGRAVHDCHAEVLCRRAFHRFLFRELEAGGKDAGSILEQEGAATWRVRPGVRLHFYVSTLPCGECTMVPISSTAEGTLGRKYLGQEEQARAGPTPLRDRNRTGAKPSTGMPEDPKANGIGFHCGGILRYKSGRSDTKPECRSVCYSCSEKLCRWNHTGWQGALLARLIPQPLTMASVVIGGPLFDEGFVREALFDRAGSPSPGVARPAFLQTSVPFHSSREVLEEPRGDPGQAKISTAGLSVVWCSPCGPEAAPAPRSISRAVPGFYDVLIGHTGERQGLRADRRKAAGAAAGAGGSAGAAAGSGAAPAPGPLDSWVSPLSKWLMAQDSLASLERLLGGEEALLKWLSEGAEGLGASLGERQEASPSRAGSSADASSEGAGGSPPPKKRRLSLPCTPSYAWLKDAAAGADFRERRRRFHQSALFSHWRRKRALSFGSPGAGVSSEERRVEDPGPDVVDGFAVALPEGRSLGGGARSAGDRDPEGKEGRPG